MRFMRFIFASLGAVLALAAVPAGATQASFPDRPIKIVVPFGPGSATDGFARTLASYLQQQFGQPVVVENKPGAQGVVAASFVAKSEPDGYTLFMTTNTTQSAAQGIIKNVPYDPLKDFTSIARLGGIYSFLVVYPGLPVKTLPELIAYAKENPGKLSYATGNSTGVIVGATLTRLAGIDMLPVRYNTTVQGLNDVMGGHIPVMITDAVTGLPQVAAGKVRPLAATGATRLKQLPDMPTISEVALPGFDLDAWLGLFGPAGMPKPVVAAIEAKVKSFLADKETAARLEQIGFAVVFSPSEEFDRFVKAEYPKWMQAVKDAGITPQ